VPAGTRVYRDELRPRLVSRSSRMHFLALDRTGGVRLGVNDDDGDAALHSQGCGAFGTPAARSLFLIIASRFGNARSEQRTQQGCFKKARAGSTSSLSFASIVRRPE